MKPFAFVVVLATLSSCSLLVDFDRSRILDAGADADVDGEIDEEVDDAG